MESLPGTTASDVGGRATRAGSFLFVEKYGGVLWPSIVYLLLAGATLGWQSYSMDELVELGIARKPIREVIHEPNSFPPAFHLLARLGLQIWDSPALIRWMSVGWGWAAIVATYSCGRRLFSPWVGSLAAGLLAINPFHLYYAQQGRAYAMYYALVIISWAGLIRGMREGGRRAWIPFVVASVLGCYTHYYFAIYLAVAFVTVPLIGRPARLSGANGSDESVSKRRRMLADLRAAFVPFAMVALLALPALCLLPGDFKFQAELREPRPPSPLTLGFTYLCFFTGATLGPSLAELHQLSGREAVVEIAPWMSAILIALAAIVILPRWRSTHWRAPGTDLGTLRARRALLILAFLPTLLIGLAGWSCGITYNIRFTGWCLFPVLLWIASYFDSELIPWRGSPRGVPSAMWCGLACLAAVGLCGLEQRHFSPRHMNEDLAAVVEYLTAHGPAADPVYVTSWYMGNPLRFHLSNSHSSGPTDNPIIPLPDAEQSKAFPEEALAVLREARAKGKYWLVYTRAFHGDPQGELLRRGLAEGLFHERHRVAGAVIYAGGE